MKKRVVEVHCPTCGIVYCVVENGAYYPFYEPPAEYILEHWDGGYSACPDCKKAAEADYVRLPDGGIAWGPDLG